MGREVKVVLLDVEIMLYHWYDTVHDEVGRKTEKWSVHEDNLLIIHDDLVLMTAKETITWMIENN